MLESSLVGVAEWHGHVRRRNAALQKDSIIRNQEGTDFTHVQVIPATAANTQVSMHSAYCNKQNKQKLPNLLRLSFFSPLVRHVSRCLLMYC